MKHVTGFSMIMITLAVLGVLHGCEKNASQHLQNAILMMEGETDYSNPIFDDVLKELRMVSQDSSSYDEAQDLIKRIERVRKYITETRELESVVKQELEAQREKEQLEREKRIHEILSHREAIFRETEAEAALRQKIAEMDRKEKELIAEQEKQRRFQGTPTPNPFQFTPTDDQGRGEEYWRNRKERLEQQLSSLENRKEQLERQLGLYETADLPRQAIIENREKREQVLAQLADTETQIEAKKEEIDNLQNELRKAGGLPGWIR